ncbi:MAG: hypothetical protein ACLTFB_00970 [Candidatus Phytoplasma pyri]
MAKKILKDPNYSIGNYLDLIEEIELVEEDGSGSEEPVYGIIDQLSKIEELLTDFVFNGGSGIELYPVDNTDLNVVEDIENKVTNFNSKLKDIIEQIGNVTHDLKQLTWAIYDLKEEEYKVICE